MTKKYQINTSDKQQIQLKEPGDYQIFLAHPGAETEIIGSFKAVNQQQLKVKVEVIHQAPHTQANTVLKGVADDQSKITFIGRIIIDKNCGDTQSFLEERILLLSDQAKAEAVPDLEIESDDVKCSHAASISPIPEKQLFYLMSRGLDKQAAQKLIVEGFLDI